MSTALAVASVGPIEVFAHAALLQKVLILGLLAAMAACVVIGVRKLAAGPHLAGGSAFVAGVRLGGPIAGVLGAAFAVLRLSAGVAASAGDLSIKALAPGLAEASAVIFLGFAAGVIAVAVNGLIEARIDRAVLAHD